MKCASAEFIEISKEILNRGDCLRFKASGGSMYPFIKDGQIIQVRPARISEIKSGDIILYLSLDNRIVIHRLIKKLKENGKMLFLVKGDYVSHYEYVHADRVLGKVVSIQKGNKTVRIENGLLWMINVLWARLSPFSKWFYFLPRKIKHRIYKKSKVCRQKSC